MLAGVRGIMEDGWDSGAHHQGGTVRLIQVAQQAHDLQRAAEFYSQLLGAQPAAIYGPPELLFFSIWKAFGSCWSAARRRRFSIWRWRTSG